MAHLTATVPVRQILVAALIALGAIGAAGAQNAQGSKPASTSDSAKFDVMEFRVLGNTLLGTRAVEQSVYPYLGPNKSLADLQIARDALATAYRNAGFGTVIVDIPEQSVDEGIVRLRVTEGKLQNVRVSGAQYYSERRILNELPALKSGVVPKLPELQTQLAQLAAEAPDRQITPVLKAGSAPGTVDVDLKVDDRLPLHASVELDNNNSADTTPLRATALVSYTNMFQRDDTLALQYETAPEHSAEVRLAALTYSGRTSDPSWTWNAFGILSDSDVAAVGTLSVIGDGKIGGAALTRSLDSSAVWSDAVSFGTTYKDFTQNVHLIGAAGSVTPIHYMVWSATYTYRALSGPFSASGSIAANLGIRGISSQDSDFEFNRANSHADFLYLRGTNALSYRYWRDGALSLTLNYQYSQNPLVNNEQFSLGGTDSVRGYFASEALTDSGIGESLELATPSLKLLFLTSDLFGFYDAAQGEIQSPLALQLNHYGLASTGLGLHAYRSSNLDAEVEWAHVLRNGPRTAQGDDLIKFQAKYSY